MSGGADDLIKTWTIKDDSFKEKHQLEGHSLGVVSVAVNSDSTCKYDSLRICYLVVGHLFEYSV